MLAERARRRRRSERGARRGEFYPGVVYSGYYSELLAGASSKQFEAF